MPRTQATAPSLSNINFIDGFVHPLFPATRKTWDTHAGLAELYGRLASRTPRPLPYPRDMDEHIRSFTELERTTLHAGKKFAFEQVALRTQSGSVIKRECIRHPGAVVVLPILDSPAGARIVFVRNERFSVGKALLELPAGTREPNEPAETTAGRELIEETGYRAATLTPLSRFYTTPGMTDELMWSFAASGLSHVGARPEEDEALEVVLLSVPQAIEAAVNGSLADAKSILTLLLAKHKGLI